MGVGDVLRGGRDKRTSVEIRAVRVPQAEPAEQGLHIRQQDIACFGSGEDRLPVLVRPEAERFSIGEPASNADVTERDVSCLAGCYIIDDHRIRSGMEPILLHRCTLCNGVLVARYNVNGRAVPRRCLSRAIYSAYRFLEWC